MHIEETVALSIVSGRISRRRISTVKVSLLQKMESIHQNPVAKEWDLVQDRAMYIYSSAIYYDEGWQPIIEIDDIRNLLFPD